MAEITAERVWENHHGEAQVRLSTGHDFHIGGMADGFCYAHQSFSCIDSISDEEAEALSSA